MEKNRREKYIVKLPCASPIKTHGPRGLSATNSGLSVQIITLCQNETQFQMPQKQLKLPILGAFDAGIIFQLKCSIFQAIITFMGGGPWIGINLGNLLASSLSFSKSHLSVKN